MRAVTFCGCPHLGLIGISLCKSNSQLNRPQINLSYCISPTSREAEAPPLRLIFDDNLPAGNKSGGVPSRHGPKLLFPHALIAPRGGGLKQTTWMRVRESLGTDENEAAGLCKVTRVASLPCIHSHAFATLFRCWKIEISGDGGCNQSRKGGERETHARL